MRLVSAGKSREKLRAEEIIKDLPKTDHVARRMKYLHKQNDAKMIEEMDFLNNLRYLAEREGGLQRMKANRILKQVKQKQLREYMRDTLRRKPDLYYATSLVAVEGLTPPPEIAKESLVNIQTPESRYEPDIGSSKLKELPSSLISGGDHNPIVCLVDSFPIQ